MPEHAARADSATHAPARWAAVASVAVVVAWSVLMPTWRAPDEPHHVDLVHAVADDLSYPAWDQRLLSQAVVDSLPLVRFQEGSVHLEADEAPSRGERPSFTDLETSPPSFSAQPNQMPQHPPLYYAVLGSVHRALGAVGLEGSMAFDEEVLAYRLLNALVGAVLVLVIWRIARILELPPTAALAACIVPLAVPQFTHIAASVNNDNLLNVWIWLATVPLLRIARGDLSLRRFVLAAALCGLGAFTKGVGLVLPVWLALAVASGWWRTRAEQGAGGRAARGVLLAALVAFVAGGWWWLRNLVLFDELAPSTEYDRLGTAPAGFEPDLGEFLSTAAGRLSQRFWGSLGWLEVSLPGWLVVVATVLIAALVLVGLVVSPRQGVRRSELAVLLAPLVLLAAFVLTVAWGLYARSGQMPLLQGRYLFGALPGLAVVAVVGARSLLGRRERFLPLVVLVVAAAMQLAAYIEVLDRFWGPPGAGWIERGTALAAWSPLPAAGDVLVGLVVLFGWATLAWLVVAAATGRSDRWRIASTPA